MKYSQSGRSTERVATARIMNKKAWIELYESNSVVTDAYLRAIGDSFRRIGYQVEYTRSCASCRGGKRDIYVVAIAPSAVKLLAKGRRNIVFWAQGVWPEESFARNGSRIRLAVCNFVEKAALSNAKCIFVVSSVQRAHYEEKYSIDLSKKTFVMPCSNEAFHRESFYVEGKYRHPVFLYAGSLAEYQCIDRMLDAFKLAQRVLPDARLLFYTNQQADAKKLVEERGLNNVVIDYKSQDELSEAIAHAKYGFVIRDDSIVNRVSTPTKISTYIANGIIPVYSSSLLSFADSSEGIKRVLYEEHSFTDELLSVEAETIEPDVLLAQFEGYYSRELSYESKAPLLDAFLGDRFE